MMEKRNENEKVTSHLAVVMMAGLIMVGVPISSVLIMLLYSFFRNIEKSIEPAINLTSNVIIQSGIPVETFFVIVAVVFACGLALLGYVGFCKSRRKNGPGSS